FGSMRDIAPTAAPVRAANRGPYREALPLGWPARRKPLTVTRDECASLTELGTQSPGPHPSNVRKSNPGAGEFRGRADNPREMDRCRHRGWGVAPRAGAHGPVPRAIRLTTRATRTAAGFEIPDRSVARSPAE